MSKITDMTQGKPAKLMLQFAFPVILTNLGQQLYQIVDAAIVGRGVGVNALAAVGCTDWTWWLILWSVSVMAAGFATFVSRFFGQQDYVRMNRSIVISAVLSAVIALVMTVLGLVMARPLLVFMGTPANILEVLTVAITRHVILSHENPWSNVASIACIAALFAIRRYLIRRNELKEEMVEME